MMSISMLTRRRADYRFGPRAPLDLRFRGRRFVPDDAESIRIVQVPQIHDPARMSLDVHGQFFNDKCFLPIGRRARHQIGLARSDGIVRANIKRKEQIHESDKTT